MFSLSYRRCLYFVLLGLFGLSATSRAHSQSVTSAGVLVWAFLLGEQKEFDWTRAAGEGWPHATPQAT